MIPKQKEYVIAGSTVITAITFDILAHEITYPFETYS